MLNKHLVKISYCSSDSTEVWLRSRLRYYNLDFCKDSDRILMLFGFYPISFLLNSNSKCFKLGKFYMQFDK